MPFTSLSKIHVSMHLRISFKKKRSNRTIFYQRGLGNLTKPKNHMKSIAQTTFVTHSMICCKNIGRQVILEVTLEKIVNSFRYMINNLNIIEINGRIWTMSMTIWITAKQMQKYDKFLLLKKLLQLWILFWPIQNACELIKWPLIQKRCICKETSKSVKHWVIVKN